MTDVETLLVIQTHDTALDRLRHRAEALPERTELEAKTTELVTIDAQLGGARGRRDVVAREEKRLDDEGASLEAKAVAVDKRMYSGEVSSPRELQAMQSDVEALRRHRGEIDDREFEIMAEREVRDAEVATIEGVRAGVAAEIDRLEATVAEQMAAINAELAVEQSARAEHAALVPSSLLDHYESCRARARGIGVAKLIGNTCQGCHLSIPSTEVDRMRHQPPDVLAHCDNCGCILVLS